MPAIRILGAIAALLFLAFAVRRYGRRQISRLNLIISFSITLVVTGLAISPSLFDPVFRQLLDAGILNGGE